MATSFLTVDARASADAPARKRLSIGEWTATWFPNDKI